MNILFMTIAYPDVGEHNIYTDLMQEFKRNGHQAYIACSNEKRNRQQTSLKIEEGTNVLRIRTGNLTGKVNLFEKGVSTLTIERAFIKAIRDYFRGVKFELIIYSTPPITFAKAVEYFKKRDNAKTYLLLKDIFPQNAVDIGLIKEKKLVHRYFRAKEREIYRISDHIGCMSQANVDYILKHNSEIPTEKIEICPNSIALKDSGESDKKIDKKMIRDKFSIPHECTVFMYGGNLGKPQGIHFIIDCLKVNLNLQDRFFIICGQGAEYYKLEQFFLDFRPSNMLLINGLPKYDYDELVKGCDVGLIFLDHRFTIPNFPSRLLSYMEHALPVLACTDPHTDLGQVITSGKFGWWCESNDCVRFKETVDRICSSRTELPRNGVNARKFLQKNYLVKHSYGIMERHWNKEFR